MASLQHQSLAGSLDLWGHHLDLGAGPLEDMSDADCGPGVQSQLCLGPRRPQAAGSQHGWYIRVPVGSDLAGWVEASRSRSPHVRQVAHAGGEYSSHPDLVPLCPRLAVYNCIDWVPPHIDCLVYRPAVSYHWRR